MTSKARMPGLALFVLWSAFFTVGESDGISLTPSLQDTAGCQKNKLDLVIVLDSSGSVGPRNFARTRNFTNTIISNLKVGPDAVRVAVVRFSSRATVVTKLNGDMGKMQKMAVVKKMRFRPGPTYTDRALEMVKDVVLTPKNGDRPEAKDFVILTTDGASISPERTKTFAEQLKQRKGLMMMVIGIGAEVKTTELANIASDPSLIYRVDFRDLWHVVNNVSHVTCPESVTSPKSKTDSKDASQTSLTAKVTAKADAARRLTSQDPATSASTQANTTSTFPTTTAPAPTTTPSTTTPSTTTTTTTPSTTTPSTTTNTTKTSTIAPPKKIPITTTTTSTSSTTTTTTIATTSLPSTPETTTNLTTPETKTNTTTPEMMISMASTSSQTTTTTTTTTSMLSVPSTAALPPSTKPPAPTTLPSTPRDSVIPLSKTSVQPKVHTFPITVSIAPTSSFPLTTQAAKTFPESSRSSDMASETSTGSLSAARDDLNATQSDTRTLATSTTTTPDRGDNHDNDKEKSLPSAGEHIRGAQKDREDFAKVGWALGFGVLGLIVLSAIIIFCRVLAGRRRNSGDEDKEADPTQKA